MKTQKLAFAFALAASLLSNGYAQDNPALSVETDPSTFAMNGFAFHLRFKPGRQQHVVLGAGTYALDFPDMLINMNKNNRSEGWNVRLNGAVSLFGEYYFKQANKSWFIGLQPGMQQFRITNDQSGESSASFTNLLIMPSVGYNWSPFHIPLYIKPWMGLGYTKTISGNPTIGMNEYKVSPLIPFVTLHIGYTFNFQ